MGHILITVKFPSKIKIFAHVKPKVVLHVMQGQGCQIAWKQCRCSVWKSWKLKACLYFTKRNYEAFYLRFFKGPWASSWQQPVEQCLMSSAYHSLARTTARTCRYGSAKNFSVPLRWIQPRPDLTCLGCNGKTPADFNRFWSRSWPTG